MDWIRRQPSAREGAASNRRLLCVLVLTPDPLFSHQPGAPGPPFLHCQEMEGVTRADPSWDLLTRGPWPVEHAQSSVC